ncbi:galactosyltransferase-related protein [Magnetovibrio sp. PR-2]|uniref:glycosyltransferase family 2 protein n=1 Tax=Magnetovibrio sp. PR-2 TaxID=3120356 RepID=UPI002FCE202C
MTIRGLLAQSLPPSEIIVSLNSKKTTPFRESLESLYPDIIFVEASEKLGNVSYARNMAAKNSRSDFILFIDDDTVIGKTTFMHSIFEHSSSFDFSCGAKRYWLQPNWGSEIAELDPVSHTMMVMKKLSIEPINLDRKTNRQKLSNFSFIGNLGVVSKQAFSSVGGFDENFNGWGYEDADLMQALFSKGQRFHLMAEHGVYCFHLSHSTDKSQVHRNIDLYKEKCRQRGRTFRLNHLLGVFEGDGYKAST